MHHELLSAGARALALLQHPPMHTCPHTWLQRWYSFFEYRQDLKLPLVFRAQVRSEATDPFLLGANATSMLQERHAAVCFAVLKVLSVRRLPSVCTVLWRVVAGALRARLQWGAVLSFIPCNRLGRCTWTGRMSMFST